MPRQEPLNDLIIRSLESRQERFRALNSNEHFAYGRAIAAVRGVRRNITNPATQLKKWAGPALLLQQRETALPWPVLSSCAASMPV